MAIVRTYSNNYEVLAKLRALRTCIDRRHHAYYKKLVGGLACDTTELVKLSLIAYLLEDYQHNGEDKNDKDCLQSTPSVRAGWSLINVFLDYISNECRDCLSTLTTPPAVETGDDGGFVPPAQIDLIETQSAILIATQTGDNFLAPPHTVHNH
jgi:hypothetical protein